MKGPVIMKSFGHLYFMISLILLLWQLTWQSKSSIKIWVHQHELWAFDTFHWLTPDGATGNSIAIITGKFGEMKGAVQC